MEEQRARGFSLGACEYLVKPVEPERLVEVALGWLTSGRLRTEGIVTPVVPFGESVEAYREIDEHPERSIKLGIRFP